MTKNEVLNLPAASIDEVLAAVGRTEDHHVVSLRDWFDSKSNDDKWEAFITTIVLMENYMQMSQKELTPNYNN